MRDFDGLSGSIFLHPDAGAHHPDAYQKVRNLMLSDDPEASAMPSLEILTDDAIFNHHAALGKINRKELSIWRLAAS